MIEINLLPEDLRPKQVKFIIQPELFLFVFLTVFSLLVMVHFFLGGKLLFKKLQYASLHRKLAQLESQREKTDSWREEYETSSQQSEQINRLVSQRLTLSDKMQALSQALPNGIWFNRLNFGQKKFYLEGSVVSLKKDQMSLLNAFLSLLKQDQGFAGDFNRLELGRISMRLLGSYSVMDFIVEGDLK